MLLRMCIIDSASIINRVHESKEGHRPRGQDDPVIDAPGKKQCSFRQLNSWAARREPRVRDPLARMRFSEFGRGMADKLRQQAGYSELRPQVNDFLDVGIVTAIGGCRCGSSTVFGPHGELESLGSRNW